MKGTTMFAFVIMVCMYMIIVPLSKTIGNINLNSVSLAVGQISSWIFWTGIFEGIENIAYEIKELYKELNK